MYVYVYLGITAKYVYVYVYLGITAKYVYVYVYLGITAKYVYVYVYLGITAKYLDRKGRNLMHSLQGPGWALLNNVGMVMGVVLS